MPCRQRAGERVGIDQARAADLVGQRRVDVAIGLALGVGRDGDGALADGQVGARIGEGIVAGRRERALDDGVAPTFSTAARVQRTGEVSLLTRPGRHLVGQCRIGVAIGPALGIGRHRDRALADGQVGARIGQGVVARAVERALVDGVDADIAGVVADVARRPTGCRRRPSQP